MPSRNSVKQFGAGHYYHIYNRGANKDAVFHDDRDYAVFLSLFKRALSQKQQSDKFGRGYRHLRKEVSLIAYCLMPNHFHLLCLNKEVRGIELLMRSVNTSYSMYYNRRYQHSGHIFQGIYKASLIDSTQYLHHITRYIHRNPTDYANYPFSSYPALVKERAVDWLDTAEFWNTFDGGTAEYKTFVGDYIAFESTLDEIVDELADH